MCVFVLTDLFSLFASDLGGYAAREDIEAVLQVLDGKVPASLKKCFTEVGIRPLPSPPHSPVFTVITATQLYTNMMAM